MKKRFALCIAAALTGLMGASASAMAYTAYATTELNVRSGPGTGYRQIDVLGYGERVNVSYCEGSWCKLRGGGWASANYLASGQVVRRAPPRYYYYDNEPGVFLQFGIGNDRNHHNHNHGKPHKPNKPHVVKPNNSANANPPMKCKGLAPGQRCNPWNK